MKQGMVRYKVEANRAEENAAAGEGSIAISLNDRASAEL